MQIERHDEVALLRMQSGKANAMNSEFLGRLEAAIAEARAGGARAIVITGNGTMFSAGLDIPTLYPLDRDAMRAVIERFDVAMMSVFNCPTPIVAAVDGHAIAGGCVLALQADYRIIADADIKIGLNEVQIGVGLPLAVIEELRCQVPVTSLRPIAQEGRLLSPTVALDLGLVHAIAPVADLEARALAKARELGALPPLAYAQIKAVVRGPANDRIAAHIAAANESWLDTWFSDDARQRIGAILERLQSKSGG